MNKTCGHSRPRLCLIRSFPFKPEGRHVKAMPVRAWNKLPTTNSSPRSGRHNEYALCRSLRELNEELMLLSYPRAWRPWLHYIALTGFTDCRMFKNNRKSNIVNLSHRDRKLPPPPCLHILHQLRSAGRLDCFRCGGLDFLLACTRFVLRTARRSK